MVEKPKLHDPAHRLNQMSDGSIREWNAESYNRLSDPQFGWGLKVIERVRARGLRGDELVLDAGCGTARVTAELARSFPGIRVIGVDLSENMVATGRANLDPHLASRIALTCADLQQLPFTRVFDGVFSTATFHWVKDHEHLFRMLFSVLKPGGWLTAQCGGGANLKRVRDRARHLQTTPPFVRFFESWTEPWEYADEATTARRLRQAGFTKVNTWLEPADVKFSDAIAYRDFIATVVFRRQLGVIPDRRLRQQFLDELVNQAERAGAFVLDYWRLNIDASRP